MPPSPVKMACTQQKLQFAICSYTVSLSSPCQRISSATLKIRPAVACSNTPLPSAPFKKSSNVRSATEKETYQSCHQADAGDRGETRLGGALPGWSTLAGALADGLPFAEKHSLGISLFVHTKLQCQELSPGHCQYPPVFSKPESFQVKKFENFQNFCALLWKDNEWTENF